MATITEQYPPFTKNSITVMQRRYLKKDLETKEPIEEPEDMFLRVSQDLAEADRNYGATDEDIALTADAFYGIMRRQEFLPNSPTLMNAGRELQQLSACFVLPIEDDLDSIFTRVKQTALIHQSGGGTGFAFSRLRPEGDVVRSTGGVASGPASFIRVYDIATDVVKQGGTRRGANMAILSVYHADVEKFIVAKRDGTSLANFNVSIGVDKEFMDRVERDEMYDIVNPRTGRNSGQASARAVFDLIVQCAWETGDPGLVFLDRINEDNPNPQLGKIESTNPCVTGDTIVATANGPRRVEELLGQPFVALVNGQEWPSGPTGFFPTGRKKTMEIRLANGSHIQLTPNHLIMTRTAAGDQWTEAQALRRGDLVVLHDHQRASARQTTAVARLTAEQDRDPGPVAPHGPAAAVTGRRYRGWRDVYDVQIPGINAFDGNGMYLHNCGEQPLLPWESCNLGSINLKRMLTDTTPHAFDRDKIQRVTATAVHMLDNVIDRNNYPVPEIEQMTKATRRIGIGVMGWSDALTAMGVRYDSEEALEIGRTVMAQIREAVQEATEDLAETRGPFPEWERSKYAGNGANRPMRNSAPTTIAPTGTISVIAGVSSGIEPLFALAFERRVLDGETLVEMNDDLITRAEEERFMSEELMTSLRETGRIGDDVEVPEHIRNTFRTSQQIDPIWHVRMQAAFQESTENAVSKTVNLPRQATVQDVADTYRAAWDLGCKGITIYRDGSKAEQVLATGETPTAADGKLMPRARPATLDGRTYRVKTGHGNAYIIINKDERGDLFEVFSAIGKAGSCDSVTMHALTRLISLALRARIDPVEIIDQLRGNTCCPAWDDGVLVQSSADAIAIAMQRALGMEVHRFTSEEIEAQMMIPGMARGRERCPDCGGMVIREGNCPQCPACGWSKC